MAQSAGLGALRPVREDPRNERLPSQTIVELNRLRQTAEMVRGVADSIDPDIGDEDDDKPRFLRGEFDANLAEELSQDELNRIAPDLLRGIQADLDSRKDWEAMVERAIKFMGLIYEEASGELSSEGSISKAWHTLIAESTVQFWANAHAELLPASGPVKTRDYKPGFIEEPPQPPGMPSRIELAEAFETDYNHYLTSGDKQYYRDFSRMLFSMGPKGTEFRKIYHNPLRRMAVSEWVKAENLIVSNDAADISTAGRVTERIMMRHADVRRMQWRGLWLDVALTQPVDQPTQIQETIGRSQGIRPRIEIPADQLHTIYECSCELDLPGFEHEDETGYTGLPLPYIVTLDKDSRQILAIVRNWKEDDDNFEARQRYVMFGLLPGFGLYDLGFVHILGNTERSLTALQREVIDNTMMAIFPGWFAAKGAFSRGDTQVQVGPAGVKEVDLGMNKSINDVVKPIQVAQISQAHMALFDKLETNGRKIASVLEVPIGEGSADIPVGTMIALIEQGTKVMAAVHKGLHAARVQELELLRDLIAEDPTTLERIAPSRTRWTEMVEEFRDMDLVPSSDPNTPSHVHRVMQFVGLGQLAQMFPDQANRPAIYKAGLAVLRVPDPQSFINPNPQQSMPDPEAQKAQTKIAQAQLSAGVKDRDTQVRAQTAVMESQNKVKEALIDQQTEKMKTQAQVVGDAMRQRHEQTAQAIDAERERAHDLETQARDHAHEARQSEQDRQNQMNQQMLQPQQPVKRSF